MHKKFLIGFSALSLLALAACSGNSASVTTPTNEGTEYSSTAVTDTSSVPAKDAGSALSVASAGATISVGSTASVAAVEQNEGTSADSSTDAAGR